MSTISPIESRIFGNFSNNAINFRSFQTPSVTPAPDPQLTIESATRSLLQVHQLRMALSAIKPGQISQKSSTIAAQAATATSLASLSFDSNFETKLQSVEEINTAPTSFQHNGPNWIGSTVTAPWSGMGSTSDATVSGSYDGSNGEGALTFKVTGGGTHGVDDLKIRVLAPDGSTIEDVNIDKSDPLDKVYKLSNGLSFMLNEGDLVVNDTFEVNTSIVSTSFTPNNPAWTGSSAAPTIGGTYNGIIGYDDVVFRVTQGGVHGTDDLEIAMYSQGGSVLTDMISVDRNDAIDKTYSLINGLTLTLGAGELIEDESFIVAVDLADPNNYTTAPEWITSSSTPAFTGTYDGSNGTGALTFEILDTGVHGEDNVDIRVYNPDGSTLEDFTIDKDDAIDQAYELSNGLSVTFSAGNLIKDETFTIDVQVETSFSTAPNPVESTTTPAINGVYDGALGTDTLTFVVTQEGTHGTDDLTFDVLASDGSFLESINILAADAEEQSYALSNGLNFSLGDGFLALNESFTLDVNHLVPTSVDPNLSFSGTGVNHPKLEDQFTIIDGTFEINGNAISVFANDSINSVLDRINNEGIDVAAVFDAATETIQMTRNTPGAELDIVLSNDTSGFLAATKLSNATSVTSSGDETSLLKDLAIMSGVTSGSLNINGVAVAFDVNVDSLDDVLSRIDLTVEDVDADFDSLTGQVSIFATNADDLSLSSSGTGFFEALNINSGVFEFEAAKSGSSKRGGYSFSTRRDTAKAIHTFSRRFNSLFDDKLGVQADPFLQEIRADLASTIQGIFGSDKQQLETSIGFGFDFSNTDGEVFGFTDSSKTELNRSLRTYEGATEFQDLFFGSSRNDEGAVDKLLDIIKAAERKLSLQLGSLGSFVDVWA